jgi:hypothetical protein
MSIGTPDGTGAHIIYPLALVRFFVYISFTLRSSLEFGIGQEAYFHVFGRNVVVAEEYIAVSRRYVGVGEGVKARSLLN